MTQDKLSEDPTYGEHKRDTAAILLMLTCIFIMQVLSLINTIITSYTPQPVIVVTSEAPPSHSPLPAISKP